MIINKVELASNLAHNRTIEEVLHPLSDFSLIHGYNSEEDLYQEDGENTIIYKDSVQDVFNKWYDYYAAEIEKTSIK